MRASIKINGDDLEIDNDFLLKLHRDVKAEFLKALSAYYYHEHHNKIFSGFDIVAQAAKKYPNNTREQIEHLVRYAQRNPDSLVAKAFYQVPKSYQDLWYFSIEENKFALIPGKNNYYGNVMINETQRCSTRQKVIPFSLTAKNVKYDEKNNVDYNETMAARLLAEIEKEYNAHRAKKFFKSPFSYFRRFQNKDLFAIDKLRIILQDAKKPETLQQVIDIVLPTSIQNTRAKQAAEKLKTEKIKQEKINNAETKARDMILRESDKEIQKIKIKIEEVKQSNAIFQQQESEEFKKLMLCLNAAKKQMTQKEPSQVLPQPAEEVSSVVSKVKDICLPQELAVTILINKVDESDSDPVGILLTAFNPQRHRVQDSKDQVIVDCIATLKQIFFLAENNPLFLKIFSSSNYNQYIDAVKCMVERASQVLHDAIIRRTFKASEKPEAFIAFCNTAREQLQNYAAELGVPGYEQKEEKGVEERARKKSPTVSSNSNSSFALSSSKRFFPSSDSAGSVVGDSLPHSARSIRPR